MILGTCTVHENFVTYTGNVYSSCTHCQKHWESTCTLCNTPTQTRVECINTLSHIQETCTVHTYCHTYWECVHYMHMSHILGPCAVHTHTGCEGACTVHTHYVTNTWNLYSTVQSVTRHCRARWISYNEDYFGGIGEYPSHNEKFIKTKIGQGVSRQLT